MNPGTLVHPGDAPAIPRDRRSTRTFVLLGDLHLTTVATPASWRLAVLAETMATRARTGRDRATLVLMGDLVDLVQVGLGDRGPVAGRLAGDDAAACAKLDRIAAAHGELFAALGRLAEAGGTVELVVGNHDQELARPAVQEHVRALTLGAGASEDARARISFHPFAFHVPGLLYAEHGHRYHAINSAPPALRAHLGGADEPITRPLGSLLTALRADSSSLVPRARVREAARLAPTLARSLVTVLAAGRRAPARAIRGDGLLLLQVAASTGLPERAVATIDVISPPEVGFRRVLGLGTPAEPNMLRAARAVHEALSAAGAATPFYCFGHTHAADRRPLAAGADSEYLNAGAFGLDGPSSRSHGYVVVRQRTGMAPLARCCDAGGGQGAPTV